MLSPHCEERKGKIWSHKKSRRSSLCGTCREISSDNKPDKETDGDSTIDMIDVQDDLQEEK